MPFQRDPTPNDYAIMAVAVVLMLVISLIWGCPVQAQVPPAAVTYKIELKRASQRIWGPVPPIPFLAAQVHQESLWRPHAKSLYARGLTQFTPDTERWIQQKYGAELGQGGALDPTWALRAQARYMFDLKRQAGGKNECHAMLFAAMAYNGGMGWLIRDRAMAARAGDDPMDYAVVRTYNSGRGAAFWHENREYPVRIAYRNQPLYRSWGIPTCIP